MRLGDVCKDIDFELCQGSLDTEITGICYDSRQAAPGSLFVCITGMKTDGHLYADSAINNGAVAILAQEKLDLDQNVTMLLTGDTRRALGAAAANYYDHPSRQLKVIGVTGTNGKTTVTHLIQAILEENQQSAGIMGTLYARLGDNIREYGHTTPESSDIQNFFRFLLDNQARYAVMEVSSHALELNRVEHVEYHAAVFTNLTQDHLDYHGTMEKYGEAKCKLFKMIPPLPGRFAVINADDPAAPLFTEACPGSYYTYGVINPADYRAEQIESNMRGTRFMVKGRDEEFAIEMKLIGGFSVYNALAAIAYARGEQIPITVIQSAMAKVAGVPGRFEQVDMGQDYTVIVDYAHTPDGLKNILRTGREIAANRLITVFGCGGDRDRTKRPLMGEIAGLYSDFSIITSDNPRTEDPLKIIDDILPGINKVENSRYAVIPDRREAINQAIHIAKTGDMVIIAGKGHETYQLVNGQVLDFDDRKVAAELIKEKADHAD